MERCPLVDIVETVSPSTVLFWIEFVVFGVELYGLQFFVGDRLEIVGGRKTMMKITAPRMDYQSLSFVLLPFSWR